MDCGHRSGLVALSTKLAQIHETDPHTQKIVVQLPRRIGIRLQREQRPTHNLWVNRIKTL